MYCEHCGKEVKSGQKFCSNCGAQIDDDFELKKEKNIKSKNINKIFIIVIATLVLLIIFLLLKLFIFDKKVSIDGHFERIDGIDTYIEDGVIVTDSLVIDEDKLYFVDENGHKKTNTWEIIDNYGTYGYFGNLGELFKDKIKEENGKKYYLDKEGKLVTDKEIEIEGTKYYADKNGELILSSEREKLFLEETKKNIIETTMIETTKKPVVNYIQPSTQPVYVPTQPMSVQPTSNQSQVYNTPPIYNQTETTKNNMIVETEKVVETFDPSLGPGAYLSENGPSSSFSNGPTMIKVNEEISEDTKREENSNGTVKINSTIKETDTYSDDNENDCKITLLKPVMSGKNAEETDILNECMDGMIEELWGEIETLLDGYSNYPKSIIFNSATLGTVSNSKIVVNLSGTITTKSGSTKSIKYKVTYDRENEEANLTKGNL